MEIVLPFFILLLTGRLLDYFDLFPADTGKSLNLYVVYIALPGLILQQVPGLAFSGTILTPFIMPWLAIIFSVLVVLLLCRLTHWSGETTGMLLLMVPLGNTSFLGIPLVKHFFGSAGINYAVTYDQFGSLLALSSYGTFILALYGSGTGHGLPGIIKKIMLFPPFLALIAALYLHGTSFPGWLNSLLSTTAASLMPVVMVATGFQMRIMLPKDELPPLAAGLSLSLLATPILFLLGCRLVDLSGPAVQVSLLQTAMPPMVIAGAMAAMGGLKPELSSAMAAYGILLSFFTLPLIYGWL